MTYNPGMPPVPPPPPGAYGGGPYGGQGFGGPPMPEGPITSDVACRKCGYNLRGLTPSMRCPECGTAVGYSFQGDLLRFCNPDWVDTLSKGAYLVVYGFLVIIAGIILAMLVGMATGASPDSSGAGPLLGQLAATAGWIMMAVGWWFLTQPDPIGLGEDQYGTARKIIRVALIVGIVSQILGFFVRPGMIDMNMIVGLLVVQLILHIIAVVGFFAQLTFLSKIALRIPDQNLSARAHFLRYAFAISYGLFLIVTVLVTIMTINAVRNQRAPGGRSRRSGASC